MIKPAERFEEQAKAQGWRWLDTVDSEMFQSAVSAALLELDVRLSAPPDMATAASYSWRREGAKQLVGILMSFTTAKPKARTDTRANLDHRI